MPDRAFVFIKIEKYYESSIFILQSLILLARLLACSSKIYPKIKKSESDNCQQYQLLQRNQRVQKNPDKPGKPLFVKIKRNNGDALEKIHSQ